jgi:hypothetical protein
MEHRSSSAISRCAYPPRNELRLRNAWMKASCVRSSGFSHIFRHPQTDRIHKLVMQLVECGKCLRVTALCTLNEGAFQQPMAAFSPSRKTQYLTRGFNNSINFVHFQKPEHSSAWIFLSHDSKDCTHIERVSQFNLSLGSQRTQAAQAMQAHSRHEHYTGPQLELLPNKYEVLAAAVSRHMWIVDR